MLGLAQALVEMLLFLSLARSSMLSSASSHTVSRLAVCVWFHSSNLSSPGTERKSE